jgi:hypothetical protein
LAAAAAVMIALVLIVGVGIAIQFGVSRIRASRDGAAQIANQNNIPITSSSPVMATSASEDLRGTWAGTYGPMGFATKLVIKNQKGDKLDGVLEQGTTRVAFKGTYDSESRKLTMTQTELLSGEDWSLGEDVGTLSSDGKKLTGSGKDALGGSLGITYQWSFSRK